MTGSPRDIIGESRPSPRQHRRWWGLRRGERWHHSGCPVRGRHDAAEAISGGQAVGPEVGGLTRLTAWLRMVEVTSSPCGPRRCRCPFESGERKGHQRRFRGTLPSIPALTPDGARIVDHPTGQGTRVNLQHDVVNDGLFILTNDLTNPGQR